MTSTPTLSRLAFVDIETTGLDPILHEPWEVALWVLDGATLEPETAEPRVWQLPVNLATADPVALDVGRYHDRRWPAGTGSDSRNRQTRPPHFAKTFMQETWGCHLVGAGVSFDALRLDRILRANDAVPGWHYHLVDIEAMAVGFLAGRARRRGARGLVAAARPPYSSTDLSKRIGVDPGDFDRHTAAGDVEWTVAQYRAMVRPIDPT